MTNSSDMETEAVAAEPAQVQQITLLGDARARWPAFALYGLATFFSFPHEMPGSENGPLELGYWVAWFGPAALVVGVAGLAPRRAAWVAFLASLVAHSVFFHWFMVVTIEYGGMPFLLGAMAPIVPALYVSIFTALFVWGYASWRSAQGRPDGLRGVIVGAAWWVAVDLARGHFLGGFPWATLGYALHLDGPMLAWTRWFGVYVLSFVIVAVGIALAGAWQLREHGAYQRLAGVVGAVILLHAVGFSLNGAFEAQNAESAETVRVAAIQGNIDQGEKWDVDRRTRILETYLRLSDSAGAEGVEWIVWPETAVPGLIENEPTLRAKLSDLALRHDAFLVVGGMGVEIDHVARRFSAFFDSAFQFDPLGQVQDRYDKTHLVPFGEFVPLRGLLGHVFQSLATGLSSNDVGHSWGSRTGSGGGGPHLLRAAISPSGKRFWGTRGGRAARDYQRCLVRSDWSPPPISSDDCDARGRERATDRACREYGNLRNHRCPRASSATQRALRRSDRCRRNSVRSGRAPDLLCSIWRRLWVDLRRLFTSRHWPVGHEGEAAGKGTTE
jgi:apolipoprotein N-acyltransferase